MFCLDTTEGISHVDGRPDKYQVNSADDETHDKTDETDSITKKFLHISTHPAIHDDNTESYPMDSKPYRGYLLIINNVDFLPESEMEKYPRSGSDKDAKSMESLFTEMGFKVESKRNLTLKEMRRALLDATDQDFRNLSCFACCILSHGKLNYIYGTDGKMKISEITENFIDRKLAGKPKLFFFQACQGREFFL